MNVTTIITAVVTAIKTVVKRSRRKPYLNNEDLYANIAKIRQSPRDAKVCRDLDKMLRVLCLRITKRKEFCRYYHIHDDMISHGSIVAWSAVGKFNLQYSNPFAYLTTCIRKSYFGFLNSYYDNENFNRYLVMMQYHKLHKPFVDEIQNTMDKNKMSNEELLLKYFGEVGC